MEFLGVRLVPVLLAAVATMIVGFLWYSPLLFAKPWTKLMGYDPNDKAKMDEVRKGAGPMYGIAFVGSLVSAFVLGKLVALLGISDLYHGLKLGTAVWAGFVATVQLTGVLFAKQPVKLFLINTGYQWACYLAMGAILALWK